MSLSKYFTKQEFEQSQTAARTGVDNLMSAEIEHNAALLCTNILDPIRQYYKKPMVISSGYRSAKLNKLIGGASTSQHCQGNAADIIIPGVSLKTIFNDIANGKIELKENYDQLIYEFGNWIHISRSAKPRSQKLSASLQNKKTIYSLIIDVIV